MMIIAGSGMPVGGWGMMLFPCSDVAAAEWIATSDKHWWDLVTLGPPGFPAYARLRFIPDPAYDGQVENEGARQDGPLSDGALSESEQLRIAVKTLLQQTSMPVEGYLLMWDGWGEEMFPERVLRTPRVMIPPHEADSGREYYLCRVSLPNFVSGAVEDSWEADTDLPMPTPAFIWPSSRVWCITSDVDPHWAGVGAEHALIDSLLADPRLDIVRVEAHQKLPFY
ncbi:hypothetical protein PTW37_08690 [Arthrobacter agilis]|uniref:hypothetical protein n=1 Tax=Arthrobacter agilis TaxID=37921 RepID=UPI002365A9FC|nr:hypothetical protein [Arthrobacter agilis]WDF31969.1 hypothetical protein PTW37_08690 [Arthrobacter agilis]